MAKQFLLQFLLDLPIFGLFWPDYLCCLLISKMFFFLTELFYLFIFCIVEVKRVEMPSSMKQYVVDCATLAYIRYDSRNDIARYLKNEFNNRYGQYWQCIVGEQFVFSISFNRNHYIYFKLDQYYVVLFQTD